MEREEGGDRRAPCKDEGDDLRQAGIPFLQRGRNCCDSRLYRFRRKEWSPHKLGQPGAQPGSTCSSASMNAVIAMKKRAQALKSVR